MNDERFEARLKAYRLPDVSAALDHRVLQEGRALVEHQPTGTTLQDVGHSLLDVLGFGYVAWLVDLVTATDAEYGVELI